MRSAEDKPFDCGKTSSEIECDSDVRNCELTQIAQWRQIAMVHHADEFFTTDANESANEAGASHDTVDGNPATSLHGVGGTNRKGVGRKRLLRTANG
jgi:hypothetical protein